MIESALIFLGKILFLFLFSAAILLTMAIIVGIAVCAVGGCACELCRAVSGRFARTRG